MHNPSSLVTLIEAGRSSDAAELLCDVGHPVSATGERSNWAALEAATRIFASDLLSAIFFMNKVHPWLVGQTPLERAEQSDEGLGFVIDMISVIEAGVYI